MYSVLHLGLSYACNMRCKHCFVNRGVDQLSISQIKRTIDILWEQGLLMIYYTYGEPLLSDKFYPITEYAKGKGLIQILMTNGSLITEEIAGKLKKQGMQDVFVSMDSPDAHAHDENRGYKGAYEKAIHSIRILQNAGISVGISSAVTEENAEELGKIYEIAQREGVRIVSFLRGRENNALSQLSEKAKAVYFDFVRWGIKQKKINLKFHDPELLPLLYAWEKSGIISETEYDKYYHMSCCHADTTVSIAPDGVVSNCNLMQNNLGNINQTPIEMVLERNQAHENLVYCTAISQ